MGKFQIKVCRTLSCALGGSHELRDHFCKKLGLDPAEQADDTPKDTRNPGLVSAFLLGVAIMLTNFSTILLYLPAMRAISASRVADTDKVVAVAVALVITLLPVLIVFGLAVLGQVDVHRVDADRLDAAQVVEAAVAGRPVRS